VAKESAEKSEGQPSRQQHHDCSAQHTPSSVIQRRSLRVVRMHGILHCTTLCSKNTQLTFLLHCVSKNAPTLKRY